MLKRIYEIYCDYCGRFLGYAETKPTNDQYRKIIGVMVIKNKIFCDENCASEYAHDLTVKRVSNLKQFAPGKSFERK